MAWKGASQVSPQSPYSAKGGTLQVKESGLKDDVDKASSIGNAMGQVDECTTCAAALSGGPDVAGVDGADAFT